MAPTDLLPSLSPGSRVLFIRLRSLGDTVLSTPLFAALKAWRPDLRIAVLVESPNGEVLIHNPDVDQVLTIPGDPGFFKSLFSRATALRKIRGARFDCCINLHGGSTSAWLTLLSGSPHRVGLRIFRNTFAYTETLDIPARKADGTKWHTVEYQMQWLYQLGLPEGTIPPLRVVPAPELEGPVLTVLVRARPQTRLPVCSHSAHLEVLHQGMDSRRICRNCRLSRQGTWFPGAPFRRARGRGEVAGVSRSAARRDVLVCSGVSVGELLWVLRGAKLFRRQ